MWRNYLKIAFRNLKRNKGYTLINVVGLAVGTACCLLIALYVRHEVSYDRFHEKADRLFQVLTVMERGDQTSRLAQTPVPMAETLQETYPEIVRMVSLKEGAGIVKRGDRSFEEKLLFAGPDFFEMFSFVLAQGNPIRVLDDPNAVVLTEPAARKYFGTEVAVGRRLSIRLGETFYDFTVSGIVEPPPSTSSIQFEILLPFQKLTDFSHSYANPSWHTLSPLVYVQLPNPNQAEGLEAKFLGFVENYVPEDNRASTSFELLPLTETHFTSGVYGQLEPTSKPVYAYILAGIALLILLVACINFMTLAVGRSASRAREVGMRKVMGAVRTQLMGQFWGEAVLLSFFGLLLGIVLARGFLPVFNELVGRSLSFTAWTHPVMLLVLVGLLVVTGLLAGSYPAVYLSRFEPARVLKGRLQGQGKSRLTRCLVVVQFTLSIFLIISTLFMTRQLDLLRTKDLGFNQEQVIRIGTHMQGQESAQLLDRYRNALADYRQVQSLTGSWEAFGDYTFPNQLPTQSSGEEIQARDFRVGYDVLETLGIELKRGRSFSRKRGADAGNTVLVNEALVAAFDWEEPIGKKLSMQYIVEGATVIGVVENFHYQSLHHRIDPLVMHTAPIAPYRFIYARAAPGRLAGALDVLRDTWEQVAPDLPFTYTFLDEAVEQQYRAEQRWTAVVTYAAVLAILIACLGLFGLAALSVSRRIKEVGIRKALGASVANIVALLSKDFTKLTLIAFVVAAPLAWYAMSRWLQDFAYRIELGPWVFVGAGLLALAIALATVSYHALRAALANPVDAIRYE